MTMARKRGRSGYFDPSQPLVDLINALERHINGGPSAACASLLTEMRAEFGEFEQSVTKLHEAGQVVGLNIIVEDFRRVARRAVRAAAAYGAPSAPQTSTGAPNASSVRATPQSTHVDPLTTSQGEVSNGL